MKNSTHKTFLQTVRQNCSTGGTRAVLEVMSTSVQHNNYEGEGWVGRGEGEGWVVEVERRHKDAKSGWSFPVFVVAFEKRDMQRSNRCHWYWGSGGAGSYLNSY